MFISVIAALVILTLAYFQDLHKTLDGWQREHERPK